MIYFSKNENDTFNLAYNIATTAKVGDIFCLIGDLGVGKTVFSKGFGAGLGITEDIVSPTFTIVQTYNSKIPLYHFDMYRIEDSEELFNIGYEEYFFGKGICLVEWADNVKDAIPDSANWIYITKDLEKGMDFRKIEVN
ncbi:MAG: tRNA (adenosine(37)-N6)-threonylcarbamoyltransferase complex ATPase subunit type 1 TsaE [Epulopiscium sp. Nuni2H_MBin003]|nr:MAG: tRNA (adenosine(37)-N6)-threonylcarbamoyltransferase complex ATPase subunit type 1 TsaE [Epulopiscium sp. Nuni2H_MBin003]